MMPYRAWDKFKTFYVCFFRFFHRTWRYRKVLAYDYDFDWEPMVEFMELKLAAMSECFEHGWHVSAPRDAKDCRVAAELCRRLTTNFYWEMHEDGKKATASEGIAQDYLGRLISKRLMCWWD